MRGIASGGRLRAVLTIVPVLIAAGATGAIATSADAASYNADGVALSAPKASVSGHRVTLTWTVQTNRPVTFRHLQLANTGQPGSGFHDNLYLFGRRTFSTVQTLPAGQHASKVVYQIAGRAWVNGPESRYSVGTATPTAEPVTYNADGVALTAPSVAVNGSQATVTWTVRTNRSLTFSYLQLANTGQPGSGFQNNATVTGSRTFTTVQTMPVGQHAVKVVYQLPGRAWVNGPETRYVVGTAGTPTAAPTTTAPAPVSPTPTASPTTAPAPTKVTTSSAPMPYPAKAVGLYHMMWSNSGSPKLSSTPANVNVVNLAFVQGDPPSLVGWGSQGEASFIADAKALRARGVRIVVSVGGAHGHVNIANRQAFVNGILALNAKLPLDGIDWDLEGPAMGTSDVVWISTELKRLRGANFAVTMAPNGSNIDHYRTIAVELHRVGALDMIGQQFYDAVVSTSAAMGRLDQLRAAGIPENKIGIGMMVGDADTYWTVDECLANVRQFKAKYPNLRGGYLWEAGRAGTADWANRVGSLLLS